MNEDECLQRFGLIPRDEQLEEIRELLREHTALERRAQGDGDTEVMKLCCVQLFNRGQLDDVLLVWEAKSASMDAHSSIDVQLLCGHGLEATKQHLAALDDPRARAALERIELGERVDDFEDFTVERQAAYYARYYGVAPS